MVHKQRIMEMASGNFRANPFIYRVVGGDAKVIFETEGIMGQYTRSNRSLQHMIENYGILIAGLLLVSMVFPIAMFVITLIWAMG